jgi:hypothetical protein
MRGDFSRLSPDSGEYSAVLMQQGRVLTDADWNDATGTSLWSQRALAADVIGPHGGPRGNLGFTPTLIDRDGSVDLELSSGVYYVDGIRCELPASLVPMGHGAMPWNDQPYPIALEPVALPTSPHLVYLDVWERHVSALEDDALRDVALDGVDTTRRQVIWQVRVMTYPAGDGVTSGDIFPLEGWREKLRGQPPRMRARTTPPTTVDDGHVVAPSGGFRGTENHLYRVEIVSVADENEPGDRSLFVWSRENGSVAAKWTATAGNHLHVVGRRDGRHRFERGDWIELTWDTLEFAVVPATRAQLVDVDGAVLTVDPDTASGPVDTDPASRAHAKIRRWDQRGTGSTHLVQGAIEVVESATEWIPLEDGIWIQFEPGDTHAPYHVGDYWTIPARAAAADIAWPRDSDGEPLFMPAQGPEHHYAPLGYFTDKIHVCLQKAFQPLATGC